MRSTLQADRRDSMSKKRDFSETLPPSHPPSKITEKDIMKFYEIVARAYGIPLKFILPQKKSITQSGKTGG
jgi:hypothetical protein